MCVCGPTLYNVDEEEGEAHPVMIPVSSTAIPLDDLPVFKVIIPFMFNSRNIFLEIYDEVFQSCMMNCKTLCLLSYLGWFWIWIVWKK